MVESVEGPDMSLRVCWRGGPGDGQLTEVDATDPPETLPGAGGTYRQGDWDELNRCWHYHLVDA